jgi:peptidoglycan/LPS O-acetylase OafA/YrhL
MNRFAPIEGLRAWLAMAVVLSHALQFSGTNKTLALETGIGHIAVMVFIIVSGFVITHLLVSQNESYPVYITRRLLRIFPVYVVCTVASAILMFYAEPLFPWSPELLRNLRATQEQHLAAHVLAHVAMLHGAVPNNVLSLSQYALLSPAWSISLEWQFYLIAPFALALLRRRAAMLILGVLITTWMYKRGYFGSFRNPSLIFGAGLFFLVGMASRLVLPHISTKAPLAVALGATGLVMFDKNLFPFVIWVAVLALLCSTDKQAYTRFANFLLECKPAQWLGKRSYSIYLAHLPLLLIIDRGIWLLFPKISQLGYLSLLSAVLFPAVVLASGILYRYVEAPGISLGRWLISRRSNPVAVSAEIR